MKWFRRQPSHVINVVHGNDLDPDRVAQEIKSVLGKHELSHELRHDGLLRDECPEDLGRVPDSLLGTLDGGSSEELDVVQERDGGLFVNGHDDSSTGSDTGAVGSGPRSVAVTVEVTPDSARRDDSRRALSVRIEVAR